MRQRDGITLSDSSGSMMHFLPIDIRAIGAMVFQGQDVAATSDSGVRATDGGVLRIYHNRGLRIAPDSNLIFHIVLIF